MAANPGPLYSSFYDLLVDKTSPEEIIAFNLPVAYQEYIENLIAKGKSEDRLTAEEQSEVDDYLEFAHVCIMVKARAQKLIKTRNGA